MVIVRLVVIKVRIVGPYGNSRVNIDNPRYKYFLLITGGIGITPMQSICNDLIVQKFRGRDIKKIKFIWAVRDRGMARSVADYKENFWNKKMSEDLIPELYQSNNLVIPQLENVIDSEFYVTRYVRYLITLMKRKVKNKGNRS